MNKDLKKRLNVLSKRAKNGGIYSADDTPKKKKKNKKDYISNRGLYDITLSNFQFHLYTLMCTINGIDTELYVYADRTTTMMETTMKVDDTFKSLSKLDWEKPAQIDTLTFRGRFATLFLLKIARNAHKIVKGMYELTEKETKKYRSYRMILDELIYRIDLFVTAYLSLDISYAEHLEKVYAILLMSQGKDLEILQKLNDTRAMLEDAATHPTYDDGTICNNVMKMAYVLATDSLKVKATPKYDEELSFDDYFGMGNQVGTLGYAILKRREKTKGLPFLYKIVQEAKPELITRFQEADDMPELVIGIKAIVLLQIFMGDYTINNYIEHTMK